MRLFSFLLIASCVSIFPACQKEVATNQSQTPTTDTQAVDGDVLGEAILADLVASDSLLETPESSFEESIILNDGKGQIQLIEYTEELKGSGLEETSRQNW